MVDIIYLRSCRLNHVLKEEAQLSTGCTLRYGKDQTKTVFLVIGLLASPFDAKGKCISNGSNYDALEVELSDTFRLNFR